MRHDPWKPLEREAAGSVARGRGCDTNYNMPQKNHNVANTRVTHQRTLENFVAILFKLSQSTLVWHRLTSVFSQTKNVIVCDDPCTRNVMVKYGNVHKQRRRLHQS